MDFVKNWVAVFVVLLFISAFIGECAMISRGCKQEKAENTALMDKCIAKVKPLHLGPSESQAALDLCWKTKGGLP